VNGDLMTVVDAEVAEAVAEREDQRRERIAARLRRRHRRRRSVDRWDAIEIELAAQHLAAMDLAEDGKPTGLPVGL